MGVKKLSWPEWENPKWLDKKFRTSRWWLEEKKKDDGAEGLWRIHNGIYDLTKWADVHPGGKTWINLTRGLDVTEIFETFHINPIVDKMIKDFYVRDAKSPRNSPYTFSEDGFYRTLKKRIHDKTKDKKKGPSFRAKVLIDTCVFLTFLFSILAAKFSNYYIAILGGITMTGVTILAHNLFHQRDSWRMYYFQISLMSVTDWRISHAVSHHVYTNTRHDLQILLMEPILEYFPKDEKNWVVKYASWIYSPIFYSSLYFVQIVTRVAAHGFELEDILSLVLPTAMYVFSGADLWTVFGVWVWVCMCSSFVFSAIGFNTGHHHPDIFHEGDKARDDTDWGLNQIDSVCDRVELVASFPWAHLSFGDHTIHHLLPTIDHDLLQELYPIVEKTCIDYGANLRFRTSWDLMTGQFMQLTRTEINDTRREEITEPLKSK